MVYRFFVCLNVLAASITLMICVLRNMQINENRRFRQMVQAEIWFVFAILLLLTTT